MVRRADLEEDALEAIIAMIEREQAHLSALVDRCSSREGQALGTTTRGILLDDSGRDCGPRLALE